MTLQEIRDYVREFLDLDEEDLSDNLIDGFCREATVRIMHRNRHWPFLQVESAITTNPDADYYTITEMLPNFGEILAVGDLFWVGHEDAQRWFQGGPSTPQAFSVWNDRIYIWPAPITAESLAIRGYLKSSDWVASGASAEPPFPLEFHALVSKWVLSRAYAQQDDPELSAFHKQEFAEELEALHRQYMSVPASAPMILGGKRQPDMYPSPPLWPANF